MLPTAVPGASLEQFLLENAQQPCEFLYESSILNKFILRDIYVTAFVFMEYQQDTSLASSSDLSSSVSGFVQAFQHSLHSLAISLLSWH